MLRIGLAITSFFKENEKLIIKAGCSTKGSDHEIRSAFDWQAIHILDEIYRERHGCVT
jgi:hypothetical protein